jgi:hypothetical protein
VGPVGRGDGVDAKQVGEDGSGDGGGQLQHRGAVAGLRVDAESAEAFTEACRCDGSCG